MVTGEFPPNEGGVGDFSRLLTKTLVKQGHEVHVITNRTAGQAAEFEVHACVDGWNWAALIQVRQALAKINPELINLQYQAAAYELGAPIHFLPKTVSQPVVVTFHDIRVPYLFPKAGFLRRRAVNYLAESAGGVIATNAEDLRSLSGLSGLKNIVEIPIGSNIEPTATYTGLRDAAAGRAFGLSESAPVVGYFGFLNASKGGLTLLRALAELEGIQLLLIGGKAGTSDQSNRVYAAEIDALAHELKVADRIFRTGYLPPRETSATFLACDLMAMPYVDGASLRRGTLMACLAHGMPIISTQPTAGVAELRHGENIWLTPREDHRLLADGIRLLLDDVNLRISLGQSAQHMSTLFGWDSIASRSAQFFARVAGLHN